MIQWEISPALPVMSLDYRDKDSSFLRADICLVKFFGAPALGIFRKCLFLF